ncbi:exopolysaccharide biosynthesis protein [Prosthecomicrobium pneumaticum]|uniref:Uncharacterized protein n=1 Tax=Prosthecomicrobium pneumaticum TaxID=81895 RepID=A0A7W9FJ47_9HYPH|nr:hypothetical protein [Prosthecomicrobium pneumaticum]
MPASSAVVRRRLSDLLIGLAEDESRARISVGDILVATQERALGALLFIFAFPNILPTPPGTSAILGAPLIFLAAQLALGLPPWLPRVIAARSMARRDFAALTRRVVPWLQKGERLLRPRAGVLVRPPVEQLVGVVCFLLAVILFLPIPLGNMLPALAVSLFSLGILERDGFWILAGFVAAIAAVLLVWGVFLALLKTALFLIASAFH